MRVPGIMKIVAPVLAIGLLSACGTPTTVNVNGVTSESAKADSGTKTGHSDKAKKAKKKENPHHPVSTTKVGESIRIASSDIGRGTADDLWLKPTAKGYKYPTGVYMTKVTRTSTGYTLYLENARVLWSKDDIGATVPVTKVVTIPENPFP